jgi:hypothetical protein
VEEKIHVPKIVFNPSLTYDFIWRKVYEMIKDKAPFPDEKEILACAPKMEAYWNRWSKGILEELALVSHLRWQRTEIVCFITGTPKFGGYNGFSDPLSLHIQDYLENPELFLKRIIHELIHNLFQDNWMRYGNGWIIEYLKRKYGKGTDYQKLDPETSDKIHHVLLFALHAHIREKFLDKEKHEVQTSQREGYKKAWEIVQTEGYENIIHDFVEYVEEKKRSSL